MIQAAEQLQLVREDLLWAGLSFPVLTEEELAHQQAAVEDRVHFHRGIWWRRAGPCFYLPCFPFARVDHRNSWPLLARALAGFMHLSAPGSPTNGVYRAIVCEQVGLYSMMDLPGRRRAKIRKALSQLRVRPIERLDDLLTDGHEVYASWHERARWGRDKSHRDSYGGWVSKAFLQHGRLTLGAYLGDRLVAFMLPYAAHHLASTGFVASHTGFHKYSPNDALFQAFLCIARQTRGIEMAYFGPVSSRVSLDQFKLGYGLIREFPSYTWINPLIRPMFNKWVRPRYPWLRGVDAIRPSDDPAETRRAD
jgi:hypothetical protein